MWTNITLFAWLDHLISKRRAGDQIKIRIEQMSYNEQLQSIDFIFFPLFDL